MAIDLNNFKLKIYEYVESRMTFIAPNLSMIIGASTAAKILGIAGGLTKLSKMPACNLLVLGSQKKTLSGWVDFKRNGNRIDNLTISLVSPKYKCCHTPDSFITHKSFKTPIQWVETFPNRWIEFTDEKSFAGPSTESGSFSGSQMYISRSCRCMSWKCSRRNWTEIQRRHWEKVGQITRTTAS